jgi:hypothetical protein
MVKITVAINLEASPQRVWEVLEPVERHVDWMHDARAIRFTGEQRRGVGTRFDCDTKVGPLKLVDRMEITAWEPSTTMGVRHSGLVTGSGLFTLAAIDGGTRTRFTWSEELAFPWFLGGRAGEVLGGRAVLTWIWRRNLRELAGLVAALPVPA